MLVKGATDLWKSSRSNIKFGISIIWWHTVVQDCSNSSASAMELLQSYTKPSLPLMHSCFRDQDHHSGCQLEEPMGFSGGLGQQSIMLDIDKLRFCFLFLYCLLEIKCTTTTTSLMEVMACFLFGTELLLVPEPNANLSSVAHPNGRAIGCLL